MRFSVEIILLGTPPYKIAADYRRGIASLIWKAISNEVPDKCSIHGRRPLPFTFALHITDPRVFKEREGDQLLFLSDTIKLYFSSSDFSLLNYVYNGLLKIIGSEKIFGYSVEFKKFYFQQPSVIDRKTARFRLLSPLILRRAGKENGRAYATCRDKDFADLLFISTETICKNFINSNYHLDKNRVKIAPVLCSTVNAHYNNEVISATNGVIDVKGPEEVLRLIYDTGLGDDRNSGFGMLEVVGK